MPVVLMEILSEEKQSLDITFESMTKIDRELKEGLRKKCGLIVAPGISRQVAKRFAQNHFLHPTAIFMVEKLDPEDFVSIGETAPRAKNHSKIPPQKIFIFSPKNSILLVEFEYLNTINQFDGVVVKNGQDPKSIILMHGFYPTEFQAILKYGIKYFQKN
jgi:hypothetical protein